MVLNTEFPGTHSTRVFIPPTNYFKRPANNSQFSNISSIRILFILVLISLLDYKLTHKR